MKFPVQKNYTLVEVMFAGVIFLIVISVGLSFYWKVMTATGTAAENVHFLSQVSVLKERWRAFVKASGRELSVCEISRNSFKTPTGKVYLDCSRLVFERGDRRVSESLPKGTSIGFERISQDVFSMKLECHRLGGRLSSFSIVAAAEKEESPGK